MNERAMQSKHPLLYKKAALDLQHLAFQLENQSLHEIHKLYLYS